MHAQEPCDIRGGQQGRHAVNVPRRETRAGALHVLWDALDTMSNKIAR
jgi:hypothetical protein